MGDNGPIVADLNNDGVDDLLALDSSFMNVAYGRDDAGLQFTIPPGGGGLDLDFAINDTRFQFWARDEDVPLRDGEDLIDAQRRLLKIAAVGDLNGDGYTDGVRPLGNGQLAIYLGAENAVPGEVIDGPNTAETARYGPSTWRPPCFRPSIYLPVMFSDGMRRLMSMSMTPSS